MKTLTLGVAAALAAGCASAQEPATYVPPPMVRWAPPTSAVIEGRYRCGSQIVEVELQSDAGGIRVSRYVGGAGPASAEQMDQWNEWLKPIFRFSHHQFSCRPDGNELIVIRGYSASPGHESVVVPIQWGRGEIFRLHTEGLNWGE